MKTPSERGVTGAWAYQARQEAGLSVEQVADAMAAKGHAVSPATIRGIESGSKKPGARLLRVLAQVLETQPPTPPVPVPTMVGGDVLLSAVAEALLAQTRVLTDLRADLIEARADAAAERRVLAEAVARLEAELGALRAPASTADGTDVPHPIGR